MLLKMYNHLDPKSKRIYIDIYQPSFKTLHKSSIDQAYDVICFNIYNTKQFYDT